MVKNKFCLIVRYINSCQTPVKCNCWLLPVFPVQLFNHCFLYLQLGIPYGEVLCKNRYVGRTFIQPNMRLRKLGVAKKFGLLTGNFQNKRVVIIDDSIVRGNTMKPIIQMLKNAGAKEVGVWAFCLH